MRRILPPMILGISLVCAVVFASQKSATYAYDQPIDALSIGVENGDIDLAVSGLLGDGSWTAWETLEIDNEQDPLLRESNLVLFADSVSAVRVKGATETYGIHPIRISGEPVHVAYAATTSVDVPEIVSRHSWGADEELRYKSTSSSSAGSSSSSDPVTQNTDNGETASGRVQDCEDAQLNYPNEFKTTRTMKDENGRMLKWKNSYSPQVKLLAVHHTAIKAAGDERSGIEKMRALYQYHAMNRGWGDIGYHYVIDENGRIFEGKAGGTYVVGGHAYCANVGTVGIALMGNFDMEQPPQTQMRALQWLLDDLANVYDIDVRESVAFHGKIFPSPIVRHGDLVSTACPGYYVRETIGQVRNNVVAGNFDANIRFPVVTKKSSSSRSRASGRTSSSAVSEVALHRELYPLADGTTLSVQPGGRLRFSIGFAPEKGVKRRQRIADVRRSHVGIGLWQDIGGQEARVSTALFAPANVSMNETTTIPLLLQAPKAAGTYTITIGDVKYTLTVSGRAARTVDTSTRTAEENTPQTYRPAEERPLAARPVTQSSLSRSSSSRAPVSAPSSASHLIRIRLTTQGSVSLLFGNGGSAMLSMDGTMCRANIGGTTNSQTVLRFTTEEFGVLTLGDDKGSRGYRGTLECRIVDGTLALINELPLEDYLLGLAEEPDTEPYEKQRAFAIAARTYALWYMDPANRKFPGKPYDGSDSPAQFQIYAGMSFEAKNPRWLDAVRDTSREVLTYKGSLIKPPYFSSSDGRTRSPAEAKWTTFPFADIFAGKPDPWCEGMILRGHGVGMSGCGAEAQANEGKSGEEILNYYYPGTTIERH